MRSASLTGSSRRRFLGLGVLAAMAATLALGPAPAQADSVLDEVKERGTLRVAGVVYRPLQMRKPSGEYYGADPELLQQFADELGVKLEHVNAGWDTAVAGLTTGKWDLVPALCVTPKRKEAIDFSETYLMLGGVLTVLKSNDKINSLSDANDPSITFANVAGGWSEQIAKKAFPDATHKDFGQATDDQLAMEVVSGRADAAVFDTPVTISLLVEKIGDRFKFFPDKNTPMDVLPCPVAYGLKKGDTAWEEAVSDFIRRKKESGELQALFARRAPVRFPVRAWPILAAFGFFDTAGHLLLYTGLGLPNGEYAIVASVGYTVVTVVLARTFLREPVSPFQWGGIGLVVGGVAVLAAFGNPELITGTEIWQSFEVERSGEAA